MIEQFISLLRRSGFPLDEREIADILWFSRVLPRRTAVPERAIPDRPVVSDDQVGTTATAPVTTASAKSEKENASAGARVFTSSASSGRSGDQLRASRVRVPGAAALPEATEISRALRPFTRRFKAGREIALDVDETVQRTAETRFLNPVFKPQPERWFDVALVVEAVPTMAVWQQTIDEFARLLERQGAFRDVRVWQLQFTGQRAVVRESSGVQRAPEALCDPAARRLILLLSDCSSRPWRDGTLAQVVLKWARRMPVATIHLLSERLWPHTATGAPQTTVTADLPGRANAQLKFERPWWIESSGSASVPLPLVALSPAHLKQWAAMLMKPGAAYERAVLLEARPEAADGAPEAETKLTPTERVQRFRALVSSETFDLAVYLSFMPLTLPVMRLVQAAMLARPRHEQLAELLLGGIIRRRPPDDPALPAEEAEFEFIDGVREILERAIFRTELDRVLAAVSNFIEQRTGTPFDFVALLENPAGEETLPATVQPFAHLARSALKRLGISYEPLTGTLAETEAAQTAPPGSDEQSPEPAEVQPGAVPNDPWKGVFGGEAERNQRALAATVSPLTDSPDWFALKLTVRSTDPASYPLRGNVRFYLHPTFGADKPVVRADEDTSQAVYETRAWGAFTVGAMADEGRTRLELDLSRLPGLPIEFRSPLDELISRAITNNLDLAEDELPEFEADLKALNEARSTGLPAHRAARRARALSALGQRLASFGKYAEAIEFYEHALSVLLSTGQSGDRASAETVWRLLGEAQQETADLTSAQRSFEQSLKLAREFGDLMAESRALKRLAKLSEMFSETEQELKLYQQALELDRRTGDRTGEAGALQDIGHCFSRLGDLRQAMAVYEQALRLFRELSNRQEEISTMILLAQTLARLGDYRQAVALAEEILQSDALLVPLQIEELRKEIEAWQSRAFSSRAEAPPENLPE